MAEYPRFIKDLFVSFTVRNILPFNVCLIEGGLFLFILAIANSY